MNYRNNDNWYNYIVAETDLTGNILFGAIRGTILIHHVLS